MPLAGASESKGQRAETRSDVDDQVVVAEFETVDEPVDERVVNEEVLSECAPPSVGDAAR